MRSWLSRHLQYEGVVVWAELCDGSREFFKLHRGHLDLEKDWGKALFPPVRQIVLDFSDVTTASDCWDELNAKLGFPGFGRNLDALVDVLRGGFGHFSYPEYAALTVFGRREALKMAGADLAKWKLIAETLADSVAGEYGEQVTTCDWK